MRPFMSYAGHVFDGLLLFATVTLAAAYMARARYDRSRPPETVLESWATEMSTGIQLGAGDGSLKILEFMDFQCPFCAEWGLRVDTLLSEFPDVVQLTVHHLPLTNHTFAVPAAVAAECAYVQGKFLEFTREMFSHQDLIGVTPWRDIADVSGVADLDAFESCVVLPVDSFPRINYGLGLARAAHVRATPAIWINGVVLQAQRPSLGELRAMVERLRVQQP